MQVDSSFRCCIMELLSEGSKKLVIYNTNQRAFRSPRKKTLLRIRNIVPVLCSCTLHKSNVHNRTAIICIYKAVELEISAAECDWEPEDRRKCSAWLTCIADCRNKLNVFETDTVLRAQGCSSVCMCSSSWYKFWIINFNTSYRKDFFKIELTPYWKCFEYIKILRFHVNDLYLRQTANLIWLMFNIRNTKSNQTHQNLNVWTAK